MRIIILITSLAILVACTRSSNENATTIEELISSKSEIPEGIIIQPQSETDTIKGSPKAHAIGNIGDTNFTIHYYSPATRGRMIWGGLVAYGNVWVTGAHKATSIAFDKDIKIGETVVPVGKYAFFTIPGKDQWIGIFNTNWNQHLTDDYNSKDDIIRFELIPSKKEIHQERLKYEIKNTGESEGLITIEWERLMLQIPVSTLNQPS